MAGPMHWNAMLGEPPSYGSEWLDNIMGQAQQVPPPAVYPESPLARDIPGFYAASGRVYNPGSIMASQEALRAFPPVQDEMTGEQYDPTEWAPLMNRLLSAMPQR